MSNLRFVDDIVLLMDNMCDLQKMLVDLDGSALKVGLRMSISKTNILSNVYDKVPLNIKNHIVEVVDEYIYLGQQLTMVEDTHEAETVRRIKLACIAFGKLRDVFKEPYPQHLKTKIFKQCVLPV